MLILHHPDTLLHDTIEILNGKAIPAYESPSRIVAILEAVSRDAGHEVVDISEPGATTTITVPSKRTALQLLADTHNAEYLEYLRTIHGEWVKQAIIGSDECLLPECFRAPSRAAKGREPRPPRNANALPGYWSFDLSSGLSKGSWSSITASAKLAVEAARLLIYGLDGSWKDPPKETLALCRPPGHHCDTAMAGGYCYINNAVVAIQTLRHYHESNIEGGSTTPKIAILDLDFHHGNGTQDYFYSDPSVVYISIHGEDEYPYYTGGEDETGEGPGEGANWNFPLAVGSSAEEYMAKLRDAVAVAEAAAPDFLVVSLGFDTYHTDPLGTFEIHTPDYETMARTVRGSEGLRDTPAVILLEGGYVISALGENMLSFLKGWKNAAK